RDRTVTGVQTCALPISLAGSGDDRAWLEDFAEKNGVDRHVHFLSGLSNEELAACYAACEIFALPSRGEGFGLVYLEAMACGKPRSEERRVGKECRWRGW